METRANILSHGPAAFIESVTAGAINTVCASNMTSIKSSTFRRIATGQEATSRPLTNCLGKMAANDT